MNLQMGKDLQHKASYDYWKPYLYKKIENMKRFSSLLSSEADTTARVSVVETTPVPPVPEASHKCSLCGKCFSSGKALGGHSRSHSQASKKKFSNNSKEGTTTTTTTTTPSVNFSDGDDDIRYKDEKKEHTCYVCKKIFQTNNALYGHMRSHPDRVFKGISPPTTNLSHEIKNCSSISQSSNSTMVHNKDDQEDGFVEPKGCSDIDVSKSALPKWQKRDKRGRKCSESYEAAMNLVHLSSNNTKHLSCSDQSIKKFVPKSFVESTMKKREFGESSSSAIGKEHPIKRIKFVVGGSLKLGNKSKTVFSDSDVLNKGKGCLSKHDHNLEPSEFRGLRRLGIDLNEPYIMED